MGEVYRARDTKLDRDVALKLDLLLSIPAKISVAEVRLHPRWDSLRDHPRFQSMLDTHS